MKAKDALVGLLLWLGILGFGAMIMSIDSWPMWALLILAAILWSAYILIVIRDHHREKTRLANPVIWMVVADKNGIDKWTAMDGSGRTRSLDNPPPESTQPIYDQEEDH